jgi:hypothetical protein
MLSHQERGSKRVQPLTEHMASTSEQSEPGAVAPKGAHSKDATASGEASSGAPQERMSDGGFAPGK